MQIDTNVLIEYGGIEKTTKKNDTIFSEGDQPRFYYQIIQGVVKMVSTTGEGKEYIQGIFNNGESFGEPPLFMNDIYPASAIASSKVNYVRLPVNKFFEILNQNQNILMNFTQMFAKRIYMKAQSAKYLITNIPELRILGLLENCKKERDITDEAILIPFTRQEIASITGLRVETVIRTLSKMNKEKKVQINNRKLYF